MAANEATRSSEDVESWLTFAFGAHVQASRFWIIATPEERPHVQSVFFPEGLIWQSGSTRGPKGQLGGQFV
jgi:hypothetical protein